MSPAFTLAAVLVPHAQDIQRAKIWPVAPCTYPAAQSAEGHLTAQRLLLFVISGLKPRPLLQQNRQEMNYLTGPDSLSLDSFQ